MEAIEYNKYKNIVIEKLENIIYALNSNDSMYDKNTQWLIDLNEYIDNI